MRLLVCVLCVASVCLNSACGRRGDYSSARPPRGPQAFTNSPAPTREQHEAGAKVAACVNDFAFRLAREALRENRRSGVLVSPLSVAMAHAMLLAGAKGSAARDLAHALGAGSMLPADVQTGMFALGYLSTHAEQQELQLANAFFPVGPLQIKPTYKQVLTDDYDAELMELRGTGPDSLAKINDWGTQRTAGMIPQVLDHLNSQALCVLVNAATFDGAWKTPFDRNETKSAPFTLAGGNAVQVPMMNMSDAEISLGDTAEGTWAVMPYTGNVYSMVVILPRPGLTPDQVLAALKPDDWSKNLRELNHYTLKLSFPKFTFDARYDLIPVMTALGAGRIYRESDFSGIAEGLKGGFIGQDVHAAHIEVDETGTRAAATTAEEEATDTVLRRDRFVVDRPFVYAIVGPNQVIAFLGVCDDPRRTK
jgi:serpin B